MDNKYYTFSDYLMCKRQCANSEHYYECLEKCDKFRKDTFSDYLTCKRQCVNYFMIDSKNYYKCVEKCNKLSKSKN